MLLVCFLLVVVVVVSVVIVVVIVVVVIIAGSKELRSPLKLLFLAERSATETLAAEVELARSRS